MNQRTSWRLGKSMVAALAIFVSITNERPGRSRQWQLRL